MRKQHWIRILSLVLVLAMLMPSGVLASQQEIVQEFADAQQEQERATRALQGTMPKGTAHRSAITETKRPSNNDAVAASETSLKPAGTVDYSDYLLFDFRNDATAQARYASSTYSYNFDECNPNSVTVNGTSVKNTAVRWYSGSSPKYASTISNSAGYFYMGATSADVTGFYAQTAEASGAGHGDDYVLDYTAQAGDVFRIRFQVRNAVAVSGKTPKLSLYCLLDGASVAVQCTAKVSLEGKLNSGNSGAYITMEIPTNATYTGKIRAIRAQFDDITSTSADALARVYIASMYLGPAAGKDDVLFFDFSNNADAKTRYQSGNYQSYNFDTATNPFWATRETVSSTTTSDGATDAVIDNTTGTMSFGVSTKRISEWYGPWVHTTPKYGEQPNAGGQSLGLNYDPSNAEYFQIRFKITGCKAAEDRAPRLVFVYDYTDPSSLKNQRDLNYPVWEDLTWTDGEYQTMTLPLSDTFKNAIAITAIGVRFQQIVSEGSGKVVIDYMYVGPEASLPVKAMFFDFTNQEGAAARYKSYVYGNRNYDTTPTLWARTTTNNSVSITNENEGTLNLDLQPASGASHAFAQTATGEVAFGSNPLDYRPNENDIMQIRYKLENCTYLSDATVSPLRFYFKADGAIKDQVGEYAQHSVDETWVFSGQYYVVNLELPPSFTQANVINAIRPMFTNIREAAGKEGRILIDYIYVGPQDSSPQVYSAQRWIEALDTTGENFRLTYLIDIFGTRGAVRFREHLAPEFEWYDPSDGATGKNAIKVYTTPYLGGGNYSTTKTKVTTGYDFVNFGTASGMEKTINFRIQDMQGARRRDYPVAGYRYIVQVNFRVDHDYTVGGNGIVPLENRQITYDHPSLGEVAGGLFFEGETLNTAYIKPRAYDFFMELYNPDVDAKSKTDMTEKGKAYDLVEASKDSVETRNDIIMHNMFDNYALMRDTTYAGVKYVLHRIERDPETGAEMDGATTHCAMQYAAGSKTPSSQSNYPSNAFDLKTDAEFRTRMIFTRVNTAKDTLGRAAHANSTWTEAYSFYYAPKFAVVDLGRTVSVNMQQEGQQIGTWDVIEDKSKGVEYEYGFHLLSTNGQVDEHLHNIKYNFRKSFMDDSSRFLLEKTTDIYYLTRSMAGEKGQSKRTIASFESEVKSALSGTGIAYDMNLDQYYDKAQNSITYTFGDATESPKALQGSYYTTLRKVTIIPANNIYYDMDKFYREARWVSDGTREGDLQAHDYEDNYASPYGYDPNWYTNASDGEPSNHSWGRAWKTTVRATDNNARANFTFYGTGFEIISHTTSETGVIIVEVYSGSTYPAIGDDTNLVRRFMVDTYHAGGNLYQIPIVVCNDLPYGQYTVRARAYYHNIFDHHYTIDTASVQPTRSAPMAVTEENIRKVLGLSEDSPLTFIPSDSGYPKITRAGVTFRGYYDAYLDGFRIYNPLAEVITEATHPVEYFAYKLSNEVNTAATQTNTEFYNLKNDLLLDRSTWEGNEANGVLYLGDGKTQVEQGDQAGTNNENASGDEEYSVRLGMEGVLETKADHLFFDFTDSPYDESRYANAVYGGVDFIDASNWYASSDIQSKVLDPSGIGTATITVEDDYSGSGWHDFNVGSNSSFRGLQFDPGANDVYEIRLRIDNAVSLSASDVIRVGFGYITDNNSEVKYTYHDYPAAECIGTGYFTVTLPLATKTDYSTASQLKWFRNYFHFIGNGESNATITIDYIYIGPDRTSNYLLFDFDNQTDDQQRYNNVAYGGLNYDAEGWHYNHTHDTPVAYDAENGTISFSKVASSAARSFHTIITSSNSSYSSGHPLSYDPGQYDWFEIKMKIEGSPDTSANFNLKFAKGTDTSSEHVAYSCAIPAKNINSGSFFTLSGSLNTLFTTADIITAIRPEVANLTMPANSTGLKITIDYIYIGSKCTVSQLPKSPSTNKVQGNYLTNGEGSVVVSDCHGARISVNSGKFYCECSERHELTGNRLCAAGRYYFVDPTSAQIKSVCHNAPISYAHTYDSATKKAAYYYFCECGASYHAAGRQQLLQSGVSCYDGLYEIDGPANELYLKNGCGIAFDVGTSNHVQISLKSVNRKNVELWAYNGSTMENTGISTKINVEMYYDLPSKYIHSGSVFLMCKSSDSSAMMSLCNLKVFNGTKPTVKAGLAVRALNVFAQHNEALDDALRFSTNITAGAEMTVNYALMGEALADYEDFYLVVEKYGADGDRDMTTYGIGDGRKPMAVLAGGAMYTATYCGITAKEMGDRFSATLYAVDAEGKLYRGATVENSIKDFLLSKIDTVSSEMNTMAVDMLRYGAAAQLNFGYDTENLVTDGLSEAQLAYATQQTPEATDRYALTGEGVNVSTNITVGPRVELNLSCIDASVTDPSAVTCVIADENGTIIAQLPVVALQNVMFSAKYDNVGAKEMRKLITATFFEGDRALSKSVTWSVESYVAQVRAGGSSDEIAMVNAMLTYGDSVAAYMASTAK